MILNLKPTGKEEVLKKRYLRADARSDSGLKN